MRSNKKLFSAELAIAIVLSVMITVLKITIQSPTDTVEVLSFINKINDKCFELNLSLVVAFLISLIIGKAFKYKDRNMKRIARNSTILFLTNSIIMIAYVWLGYYGIAIIIPALVGNVMKFWDIPKNILEVI